MKTYFLKEKSEPASSDIVWAFDLGKGSISEGAGCSEPTLNSQLSTFTINQIMSRICQGRVSKGTTPKTLALSPSAIAPKVHWIRHEKAILDFDLAALYGVETGALNRAVKRNLERFPQDFMFQLTQPEAAALRCQTGILNLPSTDDSSQTVILKPGRGRHRKYLPYDFTKQGVAMLSSVLRSTRTGRGHRAASGPHVGDRRHHRRVNLKIPEWRPA